MKSKLKLIPIIISILSLYTMPIYANAGFSDTANEVHSAALTINLDIDLFDIVFIGLLLSPIIKTIVSIKQKAKKDNFVHYQALEQIHHPDDYRNIDPSFSEEEFRKFLSEIFTRLLDGCNAKDITEMRKYMTNELYSNTVEQLSHYKSINQTDHTECINLLDVQLKGWKKSETYITMIADIKADMIHYITDDNTGEMVSGSNTKPISLHYELSVIRPIGIRSNDRFTRSCPSCGAHIDMRYSGVCTYCGTHVIAPNTGWALSNVTVLSQ